MPKRLLTAVATAVLLVPILSACGSGSEKPAEAKTLTYWASNQGSSLEADKQILQPELDKFERQTGIDNAVGRCMRQIAPDHEEHWFRVYGHVAETGQSMRFENNADALGRVFDAVSDHLISAHPEMEIRPRR